MFIIIGGMLAVAIVIVIILKFIFKVDLVPSIISDKFGSKVNPPETTSTPRSLTAGAQTWAGVLTLDNTASINVEGKVFTLLINGKDTVKVLNEKGYKNGDTVNVMGSLNGYTINLVGLNKLIK